MDQTTRIALLLSGLQLFPGATIENDDVLENECTVAMGGKFEDEPAAFSGVVNGLFRSTRESSMWGGEVCANALQLADEWIETNRAELLGVAGNDFFLGRFSATGDRLDLAELVRRSQHRDGSTEAISVGSDIFALFHAAHESTGGIVIDGFDLANIHFADYGPASADIFPGLSTTPAVVLSAAEPGEAPALPLSAAAPGRKKPASAGGLTPGQEAAKLKSQNMHRPAAKAEAAKAASAKKSAAKKTPAKKTAKK